MNSQSVSILCKSAIKAVLLIATMEFSILFLFYEMVD
ncbi:Uncharacterized protein A9P81_1003 [Leptospira interrogans serovar Copenhageni/Icterohaemorrhagiae]|nr:Uncharacterized protein A9P81_1003 [Leptospira interrogans serovar Copenhageni/Icterohaemorrhagiae]KPA29237.1 Uncharacterized protein AMR48_1133 [Leptospira interrogans]OCC31135.1 Uncharacterized protein GNX_0312 [Leptospira interrogans serovar Canicola]QIP63300.1 hypothetical protein LICSK_04900 [Leptospira interrogans serovar Copenhageni]KPA30064.1 Uncharacterized protein AMR48_0738 [Leptospira interrogans]